MHSFKFESIEDSYQGLLKAVLENGHEVSPRGMLTKELSPVSVEITNPRKRIISHPIRKLNYGFMFGELIWILSARNDLSITYYNKQWANFTDDGEILNGAYGQRIFSWGIDTSGEDKFSVYSQVDGEQIINQFEEVYNRLSKDKDSRQGTIVLFDPSRDFKPTKDVPCTNLLRFSIRDNKLNVIAFMRSNDLMWGYPYDVFNFTMLQELMAGMLGIEVGTYHHIVDSMHIYDMHFDQAKEIINTPYESIYNGQLMDARLNEDNVNLIYTHLLDIEQKSREGNVPVKDICKLADALPEYWKNIALYLAMYCFKKNKKTREEIKFLVDRLTGEFGILVNR